jgi:hypothetical protein
MVSTAGDTSAATTLTVVDGASQLKAGHVLLVVRTNEQILVTADPTLDTAIPVKRGWGEVAGTAINATDVILVTGSAYAEGALTPTAVSYVPTRQFNYTQIFRTSLNITRTAKRTRLRTGDAIKEARREALQMHSIEMERAFIFGQRFEDLTGSQPRRSTRGLVNWIQTNVQDFAVGGVTEDAWDNYLELVFRYGSNQKLFLMGSVALNTLNKLTKNKAEIQVEPGANTYGMTLMKYITPFGIAYLRQHPLFNLSPTFRSMLVVVDVDKVIYRYMDDTDYITNRQTPGADASLDEFLTECGLELEFELAHGKATNLTNFTP